MANLGVGGGILNTGTLVLRRSQVKQNSAYNAGTMLIEDSQIVLNGLDEMTELGGGIFNFGRIELVESTIAGNYAQFGGGMAQSGSLKAFTSLRDSSVGNNTAGERGGGLCLEEGDAQMIATTMDGNDVDVAVGGQGGAIWTSDFIAIRDSTLTGNTIFGGLAGAGGGIFVARGGGFLLFSSIFDDNRAGVGRQLVQQGVGVVLNTIFRDGFINGSCDISAAVQWESLGGNIESASDFLNNNAADSCGFDQPSDQVKVRPADLKLAPLAENGGPTRTHALLAGSVAIGAALNDGCGQTDQRGFVRVDGACDSGAFALGALPAIFLDGFESGDTTSWSVTTQ